MKTFSFDHFDSDEMPHLFAALKRTFDAVGISFFLIGGRARDVWFLPEKTLRITTDVDWITVADQAVFDKISHILVGKEGFTQTPEPLVFLSPKGIHVDLLPINTDSGMSTIGWQEVFERGTEAITFDDGQVYQVATLPAIVLLKLTAWQSRPEYRAKDLTDIAAIIENYFSRFDDDIFDNHNDLFGELELIEIAAQVIGRKIKRIIGDSEPLKTQIVEILTKERSKIIERVAPYFEQPEDAINRIFEFLLKGIVE